METEIRNHSISNKEELKKAAREEWGKLCAEYTHKKVVNCISDGLKEVTNNRGLQARHWKNFEVREISFNLLLRDWIIFTVRIELFHFWFTGSLHLFNPLNAELKHIRHLLALVGDRHIVHVSRVRVNTIPPLCITPNSAYQLSIPQWNS